MNNQQAIYLLHPDTTSEALREKSHEESIKLIEEACILACEALNSYSPWTSATTPPKSGERVYIYYKSGDDCWSDLATYYTKEDIFWQDVDSDGFYIYDSEYGYTLIKDVLCWMKRPQPSQKVINNMLKERNLQ